jgi:hypothetical protein
MSYDAPEVEDFDGDEYSHLHRNMGYNAVNMGHGSKCIHCNDAIMERTAANMGRVSSFKLGRLEHKMTKLYGGE